MNRKMTQKHTRWDDEMFNIAKNIAQKKLGISLRDSQLIHFVFSDYIKNNGKNEKI